MSQKEYNELKERFKEIAIYTSTSALLGWDQETNIPKKGLCLEGMIWIKKY